MTISKATIEREAIAAAREGRSPNEACPYPFRSPEASHWLATYAMAQPRQPPDTGCLKGRDCAVMTGNCAGCCP